jgi:hypothetical protein
VQLHGEIGDSHKRRVGQQRVDDLCRRANMHVERPDDISERIAGHAMASLDEAAERFSQADVGKV